MIFLLCFGGAFPFPLLLFTGFLFFRQLEGAPIISVEGSSSGGLLRGDGSRSHSGPDTQGLGGTDTGFSICVITELFAMFGSVMWSKMGSITGANVEGLGVGVL